jgi:aryl-alcohol dehydrogenase-like predicted oxidoreductase
VERRQLGRSGAYVSAIGLGCMGMSEFYGATDEAEATRTLHRALEVGVTLLDTADVYGLGANERLVGRALRDRRERAIVATKFGMVRTEDGSFAAPDGRPEYVRSACEASLQRLGIDVIDLYQCHRVDARVPIEETVGAMDELRQQGKVRYLGLSEARPSDIRRAAAVAPIASLQSEYSLFERGIEDDGVLDICAELGIGLLAYCPLGRGILTGRLTSLDGLDETDARRRASWPRYEQENFARNVELAGRLEEVARRRACATGQLALAWLLAARPFVVPIPGTKRVAYLEENAAAAEIVLTPEEIAEIELAVPAGAVAGERYSSARMPSATTPPLDSSE